MVPLTLPSPPSGARVPKTLSSFGGEGSKDPLRFGGEGSKDPLPSGGEGSKDPLPSGERAG